MQPFTARRIVWFLTAWLLLTWTTMVAAVPVGHDATSWRESRPAPRFGPPLTGQLVPTRPFEPPVTTYGPGHRGVDLAAPVDAPVLAAGPGIVLYAGMLAGRPLVSVEHPGGLRTTYEPVVPAVAVGAHVQRGQLIGHLAPGHPECTARPPLTCLHWGARKRLLYLDPMRLVTHRSVRLLPW